MKATSLKLGVSAIAFASAICLASNAAAQSASPSPAGQEGGTASDAAPQQDDSALPEGPEVESSEDAVVAEIVVTGSSIRGIAPVGSNLVSVGQEIFEKTAATTTSEIVNTVPAISTAGATPQGQNAYSYYAPQIHQIAGSGSNSTLALIDGLRMPGGGLQYAQTDPNIIPTPAVQRVEVLADGASSIYGSDAVAGVVNFITRKRYDGMELNGRIGFGDNYRSYDLTGIWGTTWDTGGVYVAGQFLKQSEITNDKREFLSRGDYRDLGGTNQNTFNCSPATIRSGDVVYVNADSAETVPNDQGEYGFCNNYQYGTAIPGVQREGVLVVIDNEFSDKLSFTGKIAFNHLTHFSRGTPGTLSGATAFGPGSPADRETQVNPFFRSPPGTAFTQETVNWFALNPSGDYGTNNYENTTFYTTAVLDYAVTNDWSVTASGALARSNSFQRQRDTFCTTCALFALNGSPTLGGNQTVALSPGHTAVVAQTLTPTNALDVWNPLGSNRTSAEVWEGIYSNRTNNEHQNNMWQVKLEAQGPLFALPAGDLRMAAGGEYMYVTQDVYGLTPNSSGTGYRNFIMNLGPRKVTSGYLEFFAPVISSDMEVPGVQSFDISISGRIDHYNDWGSTTNPKIAANWQVNDWLKIRGNWASSFVAPPLNQIGDPSQGYLRGANGTGRSSVFDVPVDIYPEVRNLPGCEDATTVCRVGANTGREGLDRSLGAGFAGVEPQTGESWSIGVDLNPYFIPGFSANITYWATQYEGGVNSPAQPLIINSAQLRDRLVICPETCSAEQIRQFTNVENGATTSPALPSPVWFLINRDVGNVLNLDVQGIDAQFTWNIETDNDGTFTLGGTTTYYTKFDQSAPGGESFSILNTSGYNSQFPSIQFRARGQVGWARDDFSMDVFVNYTGSYKNWIHTSVIPVELGPNGNPIGGGDPVDDVATFDLHIAYDFTGDFMDGSQVYLDVKNVLDTEPPFYNGNVGGAGVGGWGFNSFVSNALGRIVSLGFRAQF